jgi:hypothetical protein
MKSLKFLIFSSPNNNLKNGRSVRLVRVCDFKKYNLKMRFEKMIFKNVVKGLAKLQFGI